MKNINVKDIYDYIDLFAPFDTALDFDNCGLLIGEETKEVKKIGIALDVTKGVVAEAVSQDIDLIVSHHPVIFHPLKKIESGSAVHLLVKNNIAAISAHTNLDAAPGGINDVLCELLGLENIRPLHDKTSLCKPPIGRIGGFSEPVSSENLAKLIKKTTSAKWVHFLGEKPISSLGICVGAGSFLLEEAVNLKLDAFLTGEIDYHEACFAKENGISLFAAGHFATEQIIKTKLKTRINSAFPQLEVIILTEQEPMSVV